MRYADEALCPMCSGAGVIREVPELGGWRKARARRRLDVSVEHHGAVVRFALLTSAARAFVADRVATEPWQFLGGRLCVDRRCADALLDGMIEGGLVVEVRRVPDS